MSGSDYATRREVLYGVHAVREALAAGRRRISRVLFACDPAGDAALGPLSHELKGRSIPCSVESRASVSRFARSAEHQGVAALVSAYPYGRTAEVVKARTREPAFFLVADRIQDPNNLGAVLRTAECCGIHGVFIPARHAAGVTPAVVKASAGASEHVPVAQVASVAGHLARLRSEGIWVYGLEADGTRLWTDVDLCGPVALVVGGEARGLRRLVRERCDAVVRLPVAGRVGCLNASVACGIMLYEVVRQRSTGGSG